MVTRVLKSDIDIESGMNMYSSHMPEGIQDLCGDCETVKHRPVFRYSADMTFHVL